MPVKTIDAKNANPLRKLEERGQWVWLDLAGWNAALSNEPIVQFNQTFDYRICEDSYCTKLTGRARCPMKV